MARLLRLTALIISLVSLAGCFRQADDNFEAVTLESPPTSAGPTSQPLSFEPTSTLPLLITVPPTETPAVFQTDSPIMAISPSSTPAQAFITPGSPLSTMIVVTPTFTLGTPASATPGGLVTPTDAFNLDVEGGNNICEYEVKGGDSLFRIAVNNDTTVADIKTLNNLTSDSIFPGDILKIPGCGQDTADATSESPEAGATALPDGWQIHTVQSGEVLGTIAERYGVRQSAIIAANNLSNPNSLSVGQKLIIPAPE